MKSLALYFCLFELKPEVEFLKREARLLVVKIPFDEKLLNEIIYGVLQVRFMVADQKVGGTIDEF